MSFKFGNGLQMFSMTRHSSRDCHLRASLQSFAAAKDLVFWALLIEPTTAVNINSSTTIRVRTGEAKPPPKWMQNLGLATFPSVYPQTPSFNFLKARVGWKILRVGNSAHWKILFLLVN